MSERLQMVISGNNTEKAVMIVQDMSSLWRPETIAKDKALYNKKSGEVNDINFLIVRKQNRIKLLEKLDKELKEYAVQEIESLNLSVEVLSGQLEIAEQNLTCVKVMKSLKRLSLDSPEFTENLISSVILYFRKLLNISEANKIKPYQINHAAKQIIKTCYNFSPEDLFIAFEKGITGNYGEIFNRFDLNVIMQWCNGYREEMLTQSAMVSELKSYDINLHEKKEIKNLGTDSAIYKFAKKFLKPVKKEKKEPVKKITKQDIISKLCNEYFEIERQYLFENDTRNRFIFGKILTLERYVDLRKSGIKSVNDLTKEHDDKKHEGKLSSYDIKMFEHEKKAIRIILSLSSGKNNFVKDLPNG